MSTLRQVCHCENCGNEADMVVTCTWVDVEEDSGKVSKKKKETRKCTMCGHEADMILDEDK